MILKRSGLALLILLPFSGEASADFEVHGGEGSWIAIRGPFEDESDALLRLGCKGSGLIDTHLGGIFGIGEGKHEAAAKSPDEEQARQNFRQALVRLRKIVGPDVIVGEDAAIQITPDRLSSDVGRFESLLRDGSLSALRHAVDPSP